MRSALSNVLVFPRKRTGKRPQSSFVRRYLQFSVSPFCRRRKRFLSDNVITFLMALLLIDYLPVHRCQANRVTFVVYCVVSQAGNDQLLRNESRSCTLTDRHTVATRSCPFFSARHIFQRKNRMDKYSTKCH